jgi:IS5 family transposase
VIAARRLQQTFADGFIYEAVSDLWEPWMRHADQALEDEKLLLIIQHELTKRCKKSKTRGRPGTTAEIILRMMLLKHFRDWSFEDLTREVRANLVYREFTRIGGGKVPDDKTMGRLARQLGPEAIEKVHQRVVEIALEKKLASGRKLRVDTTVVETNIHSDRQQFVGRWCASADARHEEGRQGRWPSRHCIARQDPVHQAQGPGDCASQSQ